MSLALIALLMGGCQQGPRGERESPPVADAPKDVSDVDAKTSANDSKVALKPAVPATPPNAHPGLGSACQRDTDCQDYLRCRENICRVPEAMSGIRQATTPVARFYASKASDAPEIGTFFVELALDGEEQQRGLMFRRHMHEDWGMLFVYPGDLPLQFWMKNTLIPLDMVFIHSSGRVVGVVENAEPLTLTPRGVGQAARYVLELNAGTARARGIGQGSWMAVDNLESTFKPRFTRTPESP